MAQNGALDKEFNPSIERWSQSSTLVYAFTRRVLTSFQTVRPVAKITREILKELFDVINNGKNPKAFSYFFP